MNWLAAAPGFSPWTLALLIFLLLVSASVYAILVQRETKRRRWVALVEWARSRSARLHRVPGSELPEQLAMFQPFLPQSNLMIQGPGWFILELTTEARSTAETIAPHWHILARTLPAPWLATGLRPVLHTHSVIDLFSLSSYPSLATTGRFMVFGSESQSARAITEARLETQLPPDIGVLVIGSMLILDFSSRHFDTIEFGRMLVLSKLLAQGLPVAVKPGASG